MKEKAVKPSHLKVIEGGPGREPTRPVAVPRPPAWLGRVAQAEWRRLVPELVRMGILNPDLDRSALADYCMAVGDSREAHAALAKEGMVIRRPNGSLAPSPWLAVAYGAERAMFRGFHAFGLTPLARRRLGLR